MLTAADRYTSATVTWVPCQGWFSARPHDTPGWIGIEGDRIVEISTTRPATGSVLSIDSALYALPLLCDTHVHVYMEPWPVAPSQRSLPGGRELEIEVADALRRCDVALAGGIGLLRDMGDPHGVNLEVKRRLARRGAAAPALLACGPGFHRPGKYGRFLGVSRPTVADIRASIDELHRGGQIDFVKLVTTGIVDFAQQRVKQEPQYTVEELSEVVRHAHGLGYRVASHCSGAEGIDINLAAGVDFIEHAYFVREDQIDRMIEQGVAWTPTLAPVQVQRQHADCDWPADVRQNIELILHQHADRIAYATSKGAIVLAGTDAGSPGVEIGRGLHFELQCMAAARISAEQLLYIATIGNARALDAKRYTPTIEVGAPASFGLYARCPWRDIADLVSLRQVLCSGQPVRAGESSATTAEPSFSEAARQQQSA